MGPVLLRNKRRTRLREDHAPI